MGMFTRGLVGRRLLVGFGVLVVAALAWAICGGPMTPLALLTAAPVYLLLRSRLPMPVSVAALVVGSLWGVVVLLVLARYTHIPAFGLVLGAMTILCLWSSWRVRRHDLRPAVSELPELAFLSTGAIVWAATIVIAAVLPQGSPVGWAMSGDAANNVLFARRLHEDGGISLGPGENPVPLTAALIAFFTLPARSLGDATAAGEILGLAEMWSWGIALGCILCGALAAALVRSSGPRRLLVSAAASLVPLTWSALSGTVALGFVNFHVIIAVVIAALVALVGAREHPAASFVITALCMALALVLWAPLVGVPGVAWLIVVVQVLRARWRPTRRTTVLGLLALLQPALVVGLLSVPAILVGGEALVASEGAVYALPRPLVAVLAAFGLVAAVLLSRRTGSPDAAAVWFAPVVGGGVCLGALLWLSRDAEVRWSYYQLKYVWLLLVILLIVAVVLGLALAASLERTPSLAVAVAVLTVVIGVGVDGYARTVTPEARVTAERLMDPIPRILSGTTDVDGRGDRVFRQVVDSLDAEPRSVLWGTGDPDEGQIMFWTLQLSADGIDDVDLRMLAYYHDPSKTEDLCYIAGRLGPPVLARTASDDVVAAVQAACPDLVTVELER